MNIIPAGYYLAVVSPVNVEGRTASIQWGPATPKSPFTAAVAFKVTHGDYAGMVLTKFFYFGDVLDKGGRTAMDRSLESLRIAGFKGDDIDTFSDQAPANQVEITVEHQEYQGKTQARIGFVQRPGGSGSGYVIKEAIPPRELKSIAGRLKNRLSKVAEVTTPLAAPEDVPTPPRSYGDGGEPAAVADDDVPF
jgi:hypothetical protein